MSRHPWWLWPNLLAIDAPIVAMLWQQFLAQSLSRPAPPAATAALGSAVWAVYLLDRWFDTSPARPIPFLPDPPRKGFARRRRLLLVPAIILPLVCGLALAPALPVPLILAAAALALAVAAYFAGFVTPHRACSPLKEIAAGLIFATGVALVVLVDGTVSLGSKLFAAAAFSLLCFANCALINHWEDRNHRPRPFASIPLGAAGLLLVLVALCADTNLASLALATGASLAGLAIVDLSSSRLSLSALRVLADAALLTPLPWLLS